MAAFPDPSRPWVVAVGWFCGGNEERRVIYCSKMNFGKGNHFQNFVGVSGAFMKRPMYQEARHLQQSGRTHARDKQTLQKKLFVRRCQRTKTPHCSPSTRESTTLWMFRTQHGEARHLPAISLPGSPEHAGELIFNAWWGAAPSLHQSLVSRGSRTLPGLLQMFEASCAVWRKRAWSRKGNPSG